MFLVDMRRGNKQVDIAAQPNSRCMFMFVCTTIFLWILFSHAGVARLFSLGRSVVQLTDGREEIGGPDAEVCIVSVNERPT